MRTVTPRKIKHINKLHELHFRGMCGGGWRRGGTFKPVHCNTHTHDYSYCYALTANFLMETNQVIKARSTLSPYYHAREIW